MLLQENNNIFYDFPTRSFSTIGTKEKHYRADTTNKKNNIRINIQFIFFVLK
jgi:hypothetical protein